jgi:uncharacterized protein DUF6458
MRTGAGLALVCVGAILAFAVTAHTSVINVQVVGWILMLTGVIGMLVPRRAYGWLGRRMVVRRNRTYPGAAPGRTTVPVDRVEEIPVPPYVARNPGTSRARAGLPDKPTLQTEPYPPGPDAEGESEVIEDLYEQ